MAVFPQDSIFPLVLVEGTSLRFIGTAFSANLGGTTYCITAAHVVLGLDEIYLFDVWGSDGVPRNRGTLLHRLMLREVDQRADLAILDFGEFAPRSSLETNPNFDLSDPVLMTFEYAKSQVSEQNINFLGSLRHGNCVAFHRETRERPRQLELSFPALKGASGAPVFQKIRWKDGTTKLEAVGVLTGNVQSELEPIQTYRYEGADGEREMTHYYLPSGVATHIFYLHKMIGD